MNTLDVIKERRSVRSFREESIPDEILNQLIHAGAMAASASSSADVTAP